VNLKIETVDELVTIIQVCAWAFVVVIIMLVFGGTVFSMLYSVIFVQQPIKSMAPIDQAFTKMLNDIVLLLTGSISTIAGMYGINKGSKALAEKLAPSVFSIPSSPSPVGIPQNSVGSGVASGGMPDFNWMGFKNPTLDEEWRAPPPPTTPPDYIDPAKEEIAHERAIAKAEAI
jgi:hypothetical protein